MQGNNEPNPTGEQPLDSAPASARNDFGPANNPEWVDSDWYRTWLETANLHEYPRFK